MSTTRNTLTDALRTLSELPGRGEPLPVFATRVLNDSHALDDGTRLSGLVLRALAALYDTAAPESASERRALWARAGIADDALSTTVLTAGLRPTGDGPVARAVTTYSRAGHATHLTLAQLRTPGELHFPPTAVHITENPSILALALRRFGPACPPLVCTSGWPNSAVLLLLRHLAEAGAPLRHHGDFDGEGLRITAHVLAKTPATPWRMSASDYLTCLTAHTRTGPARPPAGSPRPRGTPPCPRPCSPTGPPSWRNTWPKTCWRTCPGTRTGASRPPEPCAAPTLPPPPRTPSAVRRCRAWTSRTSPRRSASPSPGPGRRACRRARRG